MTRNPAGQNALVAAVAVLLAIGAPLTATTAQEADPGTAEAPSPEAAAEDSVDATEPAPQAADDYDAYTAIQEALLLAEPGAVIELPAGFYELSDGLSLAVDDVTIKGAGMDKTILSFRGQESGAEGLLVESSGVVLMDFAVEDAKGDAIKVIGADGISMIRVRAEWTDGPDPENGAYGLYPVASKNVLIDGAIARGASDAGIYVGQSENIIVRNSLAIENVAGIEIENSYYADVYGNRATHNTGGVLIFDLPGLPQQGGHSIRVFDNEIVSNDTPNFAPEGNIVGGVPMGTGVMVMANSKVEVFDNNIADNGTASVLIVAYPNEYSDENYYPYPEGVAVYGNTFGRGGFKPDNEIGTLIADISGEPIPDIVWDGNVPLWHYFTGIPENRGVYIGENTRTNGETPTFIDLDVIPYFTWSWFHSPSRELPDHDGGVEKLAPVELPQDGNRQTAQGPAASE